MLMKALMYLQSAQVRKPQFVEQVQSELLRETTDVRYKRSDQQHISWQSGSLLHETEEQINCL